MDRKANLPVNLGYMRRREGLTQTELAERAGVAQTVLSQYERGVRNPSAYVLARLAKALDVTMDELMYGEIKGVKNYDH